MGFSNIFFGNVVTIVCASVLLRKQHNNDGKFLALHAINSSAL